MRAPETFGSATGALVLWIGVLVSSGCIEWRLPGLTSDADGDGDTDTDTDTDGDADPDSASHDGDIDGDIDGDQEDTGDADLDLDDASDTDRDDDSPVDGGEQPSCGNGVPEPGEDCDDGNEDDTDGCTTTCSFSCDDDIVCDDENPCTIDECATVDGGKACRNSADIDARCDDGLFCTLTDTCNPAGECVGTGDPCADELPCTVDTACDEHEETCIFRLSDRTCLIDGTCFDQDAPDPTNSCRTCRPEDADRAWTVETDFTPCVPVLDPGRSFSICVSGTCVTPGCGTADCNVPGPGFHIADTHQLNCYNEISVTVCPGTAGEVECGTTLYCGQDAQYGWDASGTHGDRFTRTTPGLPSQPVVTDNVTRLVWQGCTVGHTGSSCIGTPTEIDWSSAVSTCDSMVWAGFDDWRLPSPYELHSIIDYGRSGLMIDTMAFPSTQSYAYWTSSTSASVATTAWYIFIRTGHSAYDLKSLTEEHYARCVRGTPRPLSGPRFVRSAVFPENPVVSDAATGLEWQGCPAGRTGSSCGTGGTGIRSWSSALSYCESLTWAGIGDWRLPNVTELASIVDHRRSGPTIDIAAFPETPGDEFWSSTSEAAAASRAWSVFFFTGSFFASNKTEFFSVRCVRDPDITL
jgi:cysteine-rich repeat protein